MTEALQSSERKRKLVEQYLQLRMSQGDVRAVQRRSPAAVAPLTLSQQQLWLHAQLAPNSPVYNEPFTIHRKGPLNVEILQKSLTEVVRRHEAWRTTFPLQDGQPVQLVHPPFSVEFPVTDLRHLTLSEREQEALRLAREDARKSFDLTQVPLFRAHLMRLADEEYRLAMTAHHLIFDGVTGYQVLLPELVTLYNAAISQNVAPGLPELDFQYADYALWQNDALKESPEQTLEYWRNQLSGAPSLLQLPTDRPRPPIQTFDGSLKSFALSSGLSAALRELSQQEGVTLFMTLLAALDTLLYRYSGQEDILVGSITAGRNCPGTEKLLGFFLNPVVLRMDLGGDPTFREVLQRARRVTLGALSHNGVPLDQLVREIQPDRDLSSNPLFQVLLSLEPSPSVVDSGWDLTVIDVETGTAKFDLCFVLDDRMEGLQVRVIYRTDLFGSETIAGMVRHWQTLLESVTADPGCRISYLRMLPEEEEQHLLSWSTGVRRPYQAALVHERVELQAKETPDNVAVACGRHLITYREMNQRANRLAHYLQGMAVGPEVTVAICMERSVEMIVAILAVLKAGGAYVPLDASYPLERLEYMLADCEAPILLTQAHLPPVNPSGNVRRICLDSDWKQIEGESPDPCDITVHPRDLAYVIYTSGSSGKPKGVLITHNNLACSNSARMDYYRESPEKYLLLSPIGFDSSVAVIFHALSSGGTLVLPEPEFSWELKDLATLICIGKITHMLCIPSLYNELLEVAESSQLRSLCTVIVAGEVCPRYVMESHYRLLPHVRLFNEYGPTEATVWNSVYACDRAASYNMVPIGQPIANTMAYVLDRNLQLVPAGVPAELYIGGDGVARGYLKQSALTREKFVANPFVEEANERIYRTGDLVRYLPDGNLEFLGRLDQQVKIRGLRIELSEIEASLGEHPDVREAAVVTEVSDSSGCGLVAYVVIRQEYATSGTELRAFLKRRLPAYMVPGVFVFVTALPRTANGKVEREALSTCARLKDLTPSSPAAPRDFVESRLLAIWKDVLGLDTVDIAQDFFALGGHSLLAAKLLARIEADFGQTLSLAFVFKAPTIELMAELLRNPDESLRARAIVPLQPQGSRLPLFWVRGGPRFRLLAHKLGAEQPVLGLDLPFSDASKFLSPYKLEDIAAYLIRAIREVQPHGPYLLAGLCVNAVIAYEIARQLSVQGERIALLAMFDGHNHAYYKDPLRDGRYSGRIKYHFTNLLQGDVGQSSAYLLDRLDEARRKIERAMWQLSSSNNRSGSRERRHDTDFVVHPAFHRYDPQPFAGKVTLFQSSDWPEGPYFDFKQGWMDLAKEGVDFYRIPGDHPSMFTEPNVSDVAAKLRDLLESVHAQKYNDNVPVDMSQEFMQESRNRASLTHIP